MNQWHPDKDSVARADRLAREARERCSRGYHDDPDNSGLCIRCGAITDGEDE